MPAPPDAAGIPPPGVPRRRWVRKAAIAALLTVGLAGLGGGGAGLYLEMTRHATRAEAAAAFQAEVASRWRRLSAGQLFPAALSYPTSDASTARAERVGIAAPASCAAALDPVAAHALEKYGCVRVLRATYVDASMSLVATAGVAIMPSTSQAVRGFAGWDDQRAGVRVAGFSGTVAHLYNDRMRVQFTAVEAGPYAIFAAVGYAAGQTGAGLTGNSALTDFANALQNQVTVVLTGGGQPCRMKDIRC